MLVPGPVTATRLHLHASVQTLVAACDVETAQQPRTPRWKSLMKAHYAPPPGSGTHDGNPQLLIDTTAVVWG